MRGFPRDQEISVYGDRRQLEVASSHAGSWKNARAVAVAFAAVIATSSSRARATCVQMCARYIGSVRRWAGIGFASPGERKGAAGFPRGRFFGKVFHQFAKKRPRGPAPPPHGGRR